VCLTFSPTRKFSTSKIFEKEKEFSGPYNGSLEVAEK